MFYTECTINLYKNQKYILELNKIYNLIFFYLFTHPEQKLCTATDESNDALSNYSVTTTESDHRELLRLIKRRKQDKFKAARMTRSAKEYQVEFLGNYLSFHSINSIIKNRINSKLTRDGSNLLPVLLYIFIFTFSG